MRDEYRVRFSGWRRDRPFWGGTILTLAGLVIAIVPLDVVFRFGMRSPPFILVGSFSAGVVTISGILSLARPAYADHFGTVGILFAIVSIVGALGGFGLGTFLGMVGGSLCIAWIPGDTAAGNQPTETTSILSRIRSRWRGVVDTLAQQ